MWRVVRRDPRGQRGLAAGPSSEALKEFIDREADVFGYLSEQDRGYIWSAVKWDRRAASIGNDLFWFQDRHFGHG